jgi:hypothetical protein
MYKKNKSIEREDGGGDGAGGAGWGGGGGGTVAQLDRPPLASILQNPASEIDEEVRSAHLTSMFDYCANRGWLMTGTHIRRFVFNQRSNTEEGLTEVLSWIDQAKRYQALPPRLWLHWRSLALLIRGHVQTGR